MLKLLFYVNGRFNLWWDYFFVEKIRKEEINVMLIK